MPIRKGTKQGRKYVQYKDKDTGVCGTRFYYENGNSYDAVLRANQEATALKMVYNPQMEIPESKEKLDEYFENIKPCEKIYKKKKKAEVSQVEVEYEKPKRQSVPKKKSYRNPYESDD